MMQSLSRDTASSGFSLLEILVAIMVFSLVILIFNQLFFLGVKTTNVLRTRTQSTEQLVLAKQILKSLFRNTLFKDKNFVSSTKSYNGDSLARTNGFVGEKKSVQFYGKFLGDIHQIGIYHFKIYLDKNINSMHLEWEKTYLKGGNPSLITNKTILIENISNLVISYFATKISRSNLHNKEWYDNWIDQTPPILIRFAFEKNKVKEEIILKVGQNINE